jgi:hypothetical protein
VGYHCGRSEEGALLGDEAQKGEAAEAAKGEPAQVAAQVAGGGKRPYSPPQLKSLGKVAELTFAKSISGSEGLSHSKTAAG